MKLLLAGLVLVLVVGTEAQWYNFPGEVVQGARDMWTASRDLKKAGNEMVAADLETEGLDKYFHARGNHDAAERGPGGRWASEVISNGKELYDRFLRRSKEDSLADQEANAWGRNGGDPNRYRPEGLPEEY